MEHLKALTNEELINLHRKLKEHDGILYSVDFIISDPDGLKDEVKKLLLDRNIFDGFVKFLYECPRVYTEGENKIVDDTLEKVKVANKDEVFEIVEEGVSKLTPNIKDARIIELLAELMDKLELYFDLMTVKDYEECAKGNAQLITSLLLVASK